MPNDHGEGGRDTLGPSVSSAKRFSNHSGCGTLSLITERSVAHIGDENASCAPAPPRRMERAMHGTGPHSHLRSAEQIAKLIADTREIVGRTMELLKFYPKPDTFVGRKTHDPFPQGKDED